MELRYSLDIADDQGLDWEYAEKRKHSVSTAA